MDGLRRGKKKQYRRKAMRGNEGTVKGKERGRVRFTSLCTCPDAQRRLPVDDGAVCGDLVVFAERRGIVFASAARGHQTRPSLASRFSRSSRIWAPL